MGYLVMILILLVILAAMIASLVFASKTATEITKITIGGSSYVQNSHLRDAHTMSVWLAVGGWIVVFLVFVCIIVYFFSHGAAGIDKESGGKRLSPWLTFILLAVTGVTFATGILSILVAENLNQAPNDTVPISSIDPNYLKAYHSSIIAASVGVGVIGLIILLWILVLSAKHAAVASRVKADEEHKIQLEHREAEIEAEAAAEGKAKGEIAAQQLQSQAASKADLAAEEQKVKAEEASLHQNG